jgi:hypothetical protein
LIPAGRRSNLPAEIPVPTRYAPLVLAAALTILIPTSASGQSAAAARDYRVLATSRTSTMEKEMNQAAAAGFRFKLVMGGETAGGSEVVVLMERDTASAARYEYRLLATSRTSTMQRELQQASEAGYDYVGQTIFDSAFGGDEVACILERIAGDRPQPRFIYRLLATNRTSTMQKELQDAAADGYEAVGLTLGKTAMGGNEIVTIVRRPVR